MVSFRFVSLTHRLSQMYTPHIPLPPPTHTFAYCTYVRIFSPVFEAILYFMWILPFVGALADACNVFGYAGRLLECMTRAARRSHNRRQGHSSADNGNDAQENKALEVIETNRLQHKRRSHILDILSSVLRIATRDGAVRTFGDTGAGEAAVAGFKDQVCELIEVGAARRGVTYVRLRIGKTLTCLCQVSKYAVGGSC